MIESLLLKQVEIITPDYIRTGDILVKHGKIHTIAPSILDDAEHVIKDSGLAVMAGIIDPHVHFREPGATHKESIETGSKAAVSGGVTSFFEMPNTAPSATTAERIAQKKAIAEKTSLANYNFFIAGTNSNLEELNSVENVPGIKLFVGSSTGNLLVDKEKDLEHIFKNGHRLIAVHSETEAIINANKEQYQSSTSVHDHLNIRSTEAAISCTKMLVNIAKKYHRRLHICHLTTRDEADFLRSENVSFITTEVSPQHLLLWAPDIYDSIGTYAQVNPPIREKFHADGLWNALADGTIRIVATDHAPHTKKEKDQGFPNAPSGMPGVESSLQLMLTQAANRRCRYEDIAAWMCQGPAEIYNVQDKGYIKEGYDADLVLLDLNAKKIISNNGVISKCAWSAFDGWETQGHTIATIVNGQIVFREGDFFDDIKGKEVQFKSTLS